MSTTRKIPGWVDGILTTRETKDIASVHLFAHKHVPDMVLATVIIGGKGYTETEVRAMLISIRDKLALGWIHPDEIETIAAKHGITL